MPPGWVTTLTRAGRRVIALDNRGHGAVEQALRSRRLSQRHHGGGCARAARSSRHRARRRDGLFDGRAHRRLPRASAIRRACAPSILGGLGIRLVDGVGLPETHRRRRWKRRRSPMSAIRPAACSAPSPSRPSPTSRRSPPASAARARRLSREQVAAYPRAGAGCGRDQGQCRRLRAGAGRAHSGRAGARYSRTATTCWRSATRCSKRACSTSLTSAH